MTSYSTSSGPNKKDLRLIFDLTATQPNQHSKRHGGGIYGEIVFEELCRMNYRFFAVYNSTQWLNPKIKEICLKYDIELYDLKSETVDAIVDRCNYPLVYSPVCNVLSNKTKSVTTIHGLRRIEMPNDWMQLCYKNDFRSFVTFFPRMMFPVFWRNRKVKEMCKFINQPNLRFITVSNHSKYSILSTFPALNENAVQVFYSPSTTLRNDEVSPYSIGKEYFLLVSGNRWEKNNLRALIALDELFSEWEVFRDFSVIVTGIDKLTFYKHGFKNHEKFICVGYVDDDFLKGLYAGCYALIYPSLNEGFGYPPLEAMSFGKPVLASAITSIPEVCGDAAIYFNPLDFREMKNRILMLTNAVCYRQYQSLSKYRHKQIAAKQNEDLKRLIAWIVSESEQ